MGRIDRIREQERLQRHTLVGGEHARVDHARLHQIEEIGGAVGIEIVPRDQALSQDIVAGRESGRDQAFEIHVAGRAQSVGHQGHLRHHVARQQRDVTDVCRG